MITNRILKLSIISIICICFILTKGANSGFAEGKNKSPQVLFSKEMYKPIGYQRSDCVLTSNVYMIRRAMILEGSDRWKEVTNSILRKYACTTSTGSSMRYAYDYKKSGLEFSVIHGVIGGSKNAKFKKLKNLLVTHPEGIVVWGIDVNGYPHGVLATHVEGRTLYAVDSAQNLWGRSKGIVKLKETTVPNLNTISHIWYINKISGKTKVGIKKEDLEKKVNEEFEEVAEYKKGLDIANENILQFDYEVKEREEQLSEVMKES